MLNLNYLRSSRVVELVYDVNIYIYYYEIGLY
jgi:hypothetical protein